MEISESFELDLLQYWSLCPAIKHKFEDQWLILKLGSKSLRISEEEYNSPIWKKLLAGNEIFFDPRFAGMIELAWEGFLIPRNSSPLKVQLDAVVQVKKLVDYFEDGNGFSAEFLNRIVAGEMPKEIVIGWLKEMASFTASARRHIPPIVDGHFNEKEKAYLKDFVKDEIEHWKIYKKLFSYLNYDFSDFLTKKLSPFSEKFVSHLLNLSKTNILGYSSSIIIIESSPNCESLNEDPLYSSLVTKYGFPLNAIAPLWEHTKYNRISEHNQLGAYIICSRPSFSAEDSKNVVDSAKNTLNSIDEWYSEIYNTYSRG